MKLIQDRVRVWILKCFGEEIANNAAERNYRFLEESLELVQSLGCDKEDALRLVDYVYSRPKGEPSQEVGGVVVTLAALCNVHSISIWSSAATEIKRIESPEVIDKIRKKQVSKDIQCKL